MINKNETYRIMHYAGRKLSFLVSNIYLCFRLLYFQISKRPSCIPAVINGRLSIYIAIEIEEVFNTALRVGSDLKVSLKNAGLNHRNVKMSRSKNQWDSHFSSDYAYF